ncbi:membrane protein [Clostridium malenominatum]|uniref:Membrane protein n=1 Tax=Clostridium malenominatum TaxID=1539 RepID=A0ABN1J614_9CLOT
MDGLLAFTVLFIIFGAGDIISSKTKAIVSTMFVSSVVLLLGFWVGLPKTIFKDSALLPLGSILIGILITHMGTLMSVRELIKQWKTVAISIASIVGIAVFVYLAGTPIIGREYSVAAAPPIAGGVVAGIMMGEAAKAKGLETIMVFSTLLVVVQGFFGYPIASICLRKEAKRISNKLKSGEYNISKGEVAAAKEEKSKFKIIPDLPKELQTPSILLAKLGLAAFLSYKIAALTNGVVNKYVVCLIIGIILKEIGFLESDILTKSQSFGLAMGTLLTVIYSNLASATPEMVSRLLWPLAASLTLGTIGIALASIPVGKMLGISWQMSLSIGITALFGFPGTFIISQEVANAEGKTEEEKQLILNEIMPKMLIAGFVTVTIASVILAGIMVKMI